MKGIPLQMANRFLVLVNVFAQADGENVKKKTFKSYIVSYSQVAGEMWKHVIM